MLLIVVGQPDGGGRIQGKVSNLEFGGIDDSRDARVGGTGILQFGCGVTNLNYIANEPCVAKGRRVRHDMTALRANDDIFHVERSEERRVGKECRSQWWSYPYKRKE